MRAPSRILVTVSAAAGVFLAGGSAMAAWQASTWLTATGALARNLPEASTPAATVSGRDVTVTWAASQLSTGTPVEGYQLTRYDAETGDEAAVKAPCSGTTTGLSCVEAKVPPGSWVYTVRTRLGAWKGPESPESGPIDIALPSLTLSASAVGALPATVSATVSGFLGGERVEFRLDDPVGGALLSAAPAPTVAGNGRATTSVTIPAGVASGFHTIFALDAAGDLAPADIEVTVGTFRTVSTTAFKLTDLSGAAPVDASSPYAFPADGRTAPISAGTAFSKSARLQLTYAKSVPAGGTSVSGAAFNLTFAPAAGTTCVYFQVLRASGGGSLGTFGRANSPLACSATAQTITTPLPKVKTPASAADLRVRLYMTNSAGAVTDVDLATISASTTGKPSFTLYPTAVVDSNGSTPVSSPWSVATAGDGAAFGPASDLQLGFGDYVPSSAKSIATTFRYAYRSPTAGQSTCWYLEVLAGGKPLATHGSATAPVSCTTSATTFQTDAVALPEVDTVAEANTLSIRIYARGGGAAPAPRPAVHDLATVTFEYIP
jgi:hypothetical protein